MWDDIEDFMSQCTKMSSTNSQSGETRVLYTMMNSYLPETNKADKRAMSTIANRTIGIAISHFMWADFEIFTS